VCPECSWAPSGNGLLEFAPDLANSSEHFPREAVARMATLEEAHFWFRARSDLIVWMIAKYFPYARKLLEVGCGTGVVLSRLRAAFPDAALTGADLSTDALAIARSRLADATFAQMDIRHLPYVEEFDVVCALDVLEHLDEDTDALTEAARSIRPGGGIVITVPQHRWLWSAMDEYGRHRRRYARGPARAMLDAAGFDVVRTTSYVSLLLPVVAASRLANRRLTSDYDPFRELAVSSVVNRACAGVLSAETLLIRRGVSFPLGTSLVIVGRRR
jgi:SAM-dependent methyltransferase